MGEQNAYSKPVTLKNVMGFAVPTIAMSLFMSFYTMVDGLFVSNLLLPAASFSPRPACPASAPRS